MNLDLIPGRKLDGHEILEQGVYSSQIGGEDQPFVLSVCLTTLKNLFFIEGKTILNKLRQRKSSNTELL